MNFLDGYASILIRASWPIFIRPISLSGTLAIISIPSDNSKIKFLEFGFELKFALGVTYDPISTYFAVISPLNGAFIK